MENNQEIFDQISDIILKLDAEDNITFVNASAKNYFNTSDNLLGSNYFNACRDHHLSAITELSASNASTEFTNHSLIIWKIIHNLNEKILIGKLQTQVITPNIYLSSLLNSLYEGLHIYWLDTNNRVILCNLSQARSQGIPDPEQLIGKSIYDLAKNLNLDASVAQKICDNNHRVISSKQPCIFEEEFEFSKSSKNFLSYKAPFYDESGNVLGILGISTDITLSKQSQAELERSKHATDFYLESILMSSPSNIYWLDKEGRAIGCNDQQLKHIGLKNRRDIIGKTIFDVAKILGWHPSIAKKINDHNQKIMKSRKATVMRESVLLNGEERVFLSSKSPMFEKNGEVVGILGISTDITEQAKIEKDLEQAKQRAEASNRAKSQFIANISHDIRTPLVGIQGLATWLSERIPNNLNADIQAILSASNELLSLLNNVILLTKLEFNEETQLISQPFNLYELTHQLLDLFTPVSKQKKLILQCHYQDNIPHCFLSMPILIQRTLLNLISNALKFTEEGQIRISIQTNKVTPKNKELFPLLIMIEDTGIGISAEEQSAIFNNFYRINPSYQGKYQGSGLGLSIAKKFIEKLGGKIWLESEPNKGSRFFISLNLKPCDPSQISNAEFVDEFTRIHASSAVSNPSLSLNLQQFLTNKKISTRVLLVEDNVLIQKSVTVTLNKLNCYVDVAKNALQALEMAKANKYDLIFLDIGLPDHDGFWVASHIRELSIHTSTPIIALTAHIDQIYRQQCLDIGINEIITKPLSLKEGATVLEKFIKKESA